MYIKNASNITQDAPALQTYQYPLGENVSSVFILAFPLNQTSFSTGLTFTYSLNAPDTYPLNGGTWLLQTILKEEQDTIDVVYSVAKSYYGVIGFLSGVFPLALIAGLYALLKWPFDPMNEFEKRRIRMANDLKKIMDAGTYKKRKEDSD
jgi:hypothetical protein